MVRQIYRGGGFSVGEPTARAVSLEKRKQVIALLNSQRSKSPIEVVEWGGSARPYMYSYTNPAGLETRGPSVNVEPSVHRKGVCLIPLNSHFAYQKTI